MHVTGQALCWALCYVQQPFRILIRYSGTQCSEHRLKPGILLLSVSLLLMDFVSQTLDAAKRVCDQVPWQVVALTAAWMLRGGLQSIGRKTKNSEESEEWYHVELLRTSAVPEGKLFGSIGEQIVGRHFKGVSIVRKSIRPDLLQCANQASS